MRNRIVRCLAAAAVLTALFCFFTGCSDPGTDVTTSVSGESEEGENPYGSGFSPTGSGDVSVTSNAAGGLQNPSKYSPDAQC